MHEFDQLEWVHTWDSFEMILYVRADGVTEDGIYMQVVEKSMVDGAECFDILYDRKLAPLPTEVVGHTLTPVEEERVLRTYFKAHLALVNDEKDLVAKVKAGTVTM